MRILSTSEYYEKLSISPITLKDLDYIDFKKSELKDYDIVDINKSLWMYLSEDNKLFNEFKSKPGTFAYAHYNYCQGVFLYSTHIDSRGQVYPWDALDVYNDFLKREKIDGMTTKEVKKYDVVSVYVCPEEERENVNDKIKNIDDLNQDFLKKLIANYNYKKIDLQ